MNSSEDLNGSVYEGYKYYFEHQDTYRKMIVSYITIRCAIALVGTIGNILTLIILKNLKQRANGHILMGYLAISDILVSVVYPIEIYIIAVENFLHDWRYWHTICILNEVLVMCAIAAGTLAYVMLSTDR